VKPRGSDDDVCSSEPDLLMLIHHKLD
jgi:hypothetical protein